jgi:N-acetyl-gamma-glutamyl-phosphate reductase
MRLLTLHPGTKVDVLTAERTAGQEFKKIYPQFSNRNDLPLLSKWEEKVDEIKACDLVFCCLPHGTTQEIISVLATSLSTKAMQNIKSNY